MRKLVPERSSVMPSYQRHRWDWAPAQYDPELLILSLGYIAALLIPHLEWIVESSYDVDVTNRMD
jgi:hypothetical protein